jgi:glucan biosynthesis protein C
MDVLPLPVETRSPARLPESPKLLGLDWLRGVAALGVVMLHACVPYLRDPMPGLAWPVQDSSSDLVNLGFWWIELFIMPLFLGLAGFLAYGTLQRRGSRGLIQHRARRLLLPLLFGTVVVLPIELHLWVLGWVNEGIVEPVKLRSFKFDGQVDQDLWGLSHLWFLQYMFLYLCVLAGVAAVSERFKHRSLRTRFGRTRRWVGLRGAIGLLVAIGTLVLVCCPEVVWGFQHSFWPVPSKWIYSGVFFAMGVVLAVSDPQMRWLSQVASRLWPSAVCVSLAALLMGRWHLRGGENQLAEIVLAGLTCLAATLLIGAMTGSAVAHVSRLTMPIRYLAAASFWIYIVHHPILGLVHIDLRWMFPEWSPLLKTGLSFSIATSLSLLTYEGLVRKTALGHWLGFAWSLPTTQPPVEPPIVLPIRPAGPSVNRQKKKAA